MPIYVFRCSACEAIYESMLKVDEIPETCKVCASSEKQEKQLTSASFTFGSPKIQGNDEFGLLPDPVDQKGRIIS
jgi:putative FmdB family regulatory protein